MVDGADTCTTLLEELNFLQQFVERCSEKVFTYEGQQLEKELVDSEEEVGDPSYQPEEEGESSSSEDSESSKDDPTSKPASFSKPVSTKKKERKLSHPPEKMRTPTQNHSPRRQG